MLSGRQRRNSRNENRYSTHGGDGDEDDDVIVEILSDLLHDSGLIVVDNEHNQKNDGNAWINLSRSLRDVAMRVRQLNNTLRDDDADPNHNRNSNGTCDEDGDQILLDMEESIHSVRIHTTQILQLTKANFRHIQKCHQLEQCHLRGTHQSHNQHYNLVRVSKALVIQFQKQKSSTRQAVNVINNQLDRLYDSDTDLSKIASSFEVLAQHTQTRFMKSIHQSPWKDAMEIMEAIVTDSPSSKDEDISSLVTSSGLRFMEAAVESSDDSNILADNTVRIDTNLNISALRQIDTPKITLHETVQHLVTSPTTPRRFHSFLLVGSEEAGKSHYLTEIENQARRLGATVVRPTLPFDMIGSTIGASEDALISMFSFCAFSGVNRSTTSTTSILILDDIESVCGRLTGGSGSGSSSIPSAMASGGTMDDMESHLSARLRGLLFDLVDLCKGNAFTEQRHGGRFILICSMRSSFDESLSGRFDRTYSLSHPDLEERYTFLKGAFFGNKHVDLSTESSLREVAECTESMSRGGLAKLCRQVVAIECLQSGSQNTIDDAGSLLRLKEQVQTLTPNSLKDGANSYSLDLRVFPAKDLRRLYPIDALKSPEASLPLFGKAAIDAWQELRRLIILPLCQGPDLDRLLYHNGGLSSSTRKSFAGGVLLCGEPGTGKSAMSYFCGAVASTLRPSVKLIDVSCTSLIRKDVGGSEKALHNLFQVIRSSAPCVVVMDGIENIASPRGNDTTTEGTMDRLLSTLLTELDGVDSDATDENGSASSGVVVIGITRMESWIDPALRRPGRLERSIYLSAPEYTARNKILLSGLNDTRYLSRDDNLGLSTLEQVCEYAAKETDGFTGAELLAVCDAAKMQALKNHLEGRANNTEGDEDAGEPFVTSLHILNSVKEQRRGS